MMGCYASQCIRLCIWDLVQALCCRTSNPVQYLDFGDNISLLGMIKYIPILWGPMSRAKFLTAFFILAGSAP